MPVVSMCIGRSVSVSAVAATLLLGTVSVHAAPIVNFDIQVHGATGGPFATNFNQNGTPTANPDVFNYNESNGFPGGIVGAGNEWSISEWDFNADDDATNGALLGAGFTVSNNLAETLNPADNHLQFSITVSMNVIPADATLFLAGAAMTLNPGSSNGSLSTTNQFGAGSPMWDYIVNGSSIAGLFPTGYSLNANGQTNSDSDDIFSPTSITINSVGIQLNFDLSAGESATFNGTFEYIPAPGALALLGLAGLIGTGRRRR